MQPASAGGVDQLGVARIEVEDARADVVARVERGGERVVVVGLERGAGVVGELRQRRHGGDDRAVAVLRTARARPRVRCRRSRPRPAARRRTAPAAARRAAARSAWVAKSMNTQAAVGLHDAVLQAGGDAELLGLDRQREGRQLRLGDRRAREVGERAQRGDDERARSAQAEPARDRRAVADGDAGVEVRVLAGEAGDGGGDERAPALGPLALARRRDVERGGRLGVDVRREVVQRDGQRRAAVAVGRVADEPATREAASARHRAGRGRTRAAPDRAAGR